MRHLFINLSIVAVSFAVCLLVSELVLRASGYSAPVFRQVDSKLGWRLYAGIEGMSPLENATYMRINSEGRNDAGFSKTKPEGALRIAFVGDSFTQAAEVSRESNFVSLVEQKLSAALPEGYRMVEAMNFGVSGYGTTQELILLEREVTEYNPDVVVLMSFLGNDISDNHRELAESLPELRPYFKLDSEHELTPVAGFPVCSSLRKDRITIELVNRSRLLQFVKELVMGRGHGPEHARRSKGREPNKQDEIFREAGTPPWQEAWQVTEALLKRCAETVAAHGSRFLLVTIPDPIVVHPEPATRDAFMQRLGLTSLDYPDQRLSNAAKTLGIPVLQLAGSLREEAERDKRFFHGFDESSYGNGHWNQDGHRKVAELVSTTIEAMLAKQ